jgi:hypothetical protein
MKQNIQQDTLFCLELYRVTCESRDFNPTEKMDIGNVHSLSELDKVFIFYLPQHQPLNLIIFARLFLLLFESVTSCSWKCREYQGFLKISLY